MSLIFEWGEEKALANFVKHGISFEETKTVFGDPFLLLMKDVLHSD